MKKSVAIVGAGAASFSLAAFLDPELYDITIYEKNKSPGRKFLVAGKGGFNLTHSEPLEAFIDRYSPASFLRDAITRFSNTDFIAWLETIGIPTYVGSSGRVFPEKGIKPILVLDAIMSTLRTRNVNFEFEHEWTGWNDKGALAFKTNITVNAEYHVFGLGGASWSVTGSDGGWSNAFAARGVMTMPFLPSNCAYQIIWSEDFAHKYAGHPLKNISIRCFEKIQKGEVVITEFGLEGNAIYALSPQIQSELTLHGKAEIFIDLKPGVSESLIAKRLNESKEKNITKALRKTLNMSPAQINLLKAQTTRDEFLSHPALIVKIKSLPVLIIGAATLDEAISTTGGIDLSEIDAYYALNKMPNTFCIGEMLDWNAPTGGYLLQACFSMGVRLARHLNDIARESQN